MVYCVLWGKIVHSVFLEQTVARTRDPMIHSPCYVHHLSTEEAQAQALARLSYAQPHARRQADARTPSQERAQPAYGIGAAGTMLARKHKLGPASLFARPHKTLRGGHITLTYAPAVGKEGAFAVVVSAKAAPSSVLRHRVKRVLFAATDPKRPYPYDVVISLQRVPATDLAPTLRSELFKLLEQTISPHS